jgi:hypothetical protein
VEVHEMDLPHCWGEFGVEVYEMMELPHYCGEFGVEVYMMICHEWKI